MKRIILTSHGFEKNKKLKQQLLGLLPSLTKNLSVVIITTASAEWKEKNKHAVSAKQALENMGFKKVAFLDVEFESPNKLKDFNLIYICGGNPFYLLYHLKKSGADKVIQKLADKGVILVGVSAGAVVLGPSIKVAQYFDDEKNIVKLKNFSALKLTDIIILPHYKIEYENKVKDFEKENHCQVTRLKDSQGVTVIEDKIKPIDFGGRKP